MKNSILVMVSAFGLNVAIAQTNTQVQSNQNTVNPPASVSTKFQKDYPNNNATWGMDEGNYAAEYKNSDSKMGMRVVYDNNGNVISTNNEMSTGKYPSTIEEYYTKNNSKENYSVWSSEDNKGNKTYYTKEKDNTVWFDKDGNYVSKKANKTNQKTKTTTKTKTTK